MTTKQTHPDAGPASTPERQARLAELRQQDQRRARRRQRVGMALTALVTLGVVGGVAALISNAPPAQPKTSTVDPQKANVDGEQVYHNLARGHVPGKVPYPSSPNPPVGGKHNAVWQDANGNVYDQPLENEHAVHSLEHGAVWVTYRRDATPAQIAAFRAKVAGVAYRMMSPLPDQPGLFELTAWGHQLTVQSADDPRVDQFLNAYTAGPQASEPGGPITGGRSTP
jgi:hypothetical protein